jgi:hypothetical protein
MRKLVHPALSAGPRTRASGLEDGVLCDADARVRRIVDTHDRAVSTRL